MNLERLRLTPNARERLEKTASRLAAEFAANQDDVRTRIVALLIPHPTKTQLTAAIEKVRAGFDASRENA